MDALTVDHTVRVPHSLRITVDDDRADSRSLSVQPPLAYFSSTSAAAITEAWAGTGLVPGSAETTTASEREGRSPYIILVNSASLDDASVCPSMEFILKPLSVDLALLSLMIVIYLPTCVQLYEFG